MDEHKKDDSVLADEYERSPEHLLKRIVELEAGAFSAEQKQKLLEMLTEYTHTIYARRILTRLENAEEALRAAGLMK